MWYDRKPIYVPAGDKRIYLEEKDGKLIIRFVPEVDGFKKWLKTVSHAIRTGNYGDIELNLRLDEPEAKEILDFLANAIFKQHEQ